MIHPTEHLIVTKPWWDTVDALGTAVVSPVVARNRSLVGQMWRWLESGDRWLVRAAIQHQRGRGQATDIALLLAMCEPYAAEREFFIAKAIGWALRDTARWYPEAVRAVRRRASGPQRRGPARGRQGRGPLSPSLIRSSAPVSSAGMIHTLFASPLATSGIAWR